MFRPHYCGRPPASLLLRGRAGDGVALNRLLAGQQWLHPAPPLPLLVCPAEPALNAWVNNVADPLLSFDAKELIEALAGIPACLPSLQVLH